MRVAILADNYVAEEIKSLRMPATVELVWADSVTVLLMLENIDFYFDFMFSMDAERIARLKKLFPKTVFIDSVANTLAETGQEFIRINGWPGAIGRNMIELAATVSQHQRIKEVMNALEWNYKIVPDLPGMVTPRVIAGIINEAYYTFGGGISSKAEIDIAMKLGTNYPLGPFEWADLIGLEKVHEVLAVTANSDSADGIAPALLSALKPNNILP